MALSGNILSRDLRYINGFDKQTTRQISHGKMKLFYPKLGIFIKKLECCLGKAKMLQQKKKSP